MMKKKILAILCALSVVYADLGAFAISVSASTDILTTGNITSSKSGNIFSATDTLTFTQNWKNTTNERIDCQADWEIVDEDGATVSTMSRTGTLEANGSVNLSFTIDNPGKYGVYKIKATEKSNKKSEPSTVYTDTYEADFSICISLNGSNVNPQFGYNQPMVRTGAADPAVAAPLMVSGGAKWHREDVEWSEVEKAAGVYSISSSTKSRLRGVKNSGLESVCILKGLNPVYDSKAPSTDAEIAAFANYCRYVATELGGLADHFEIWNEWNVSTFNPTRETAGTYAKVLKAAYNAIKGVDPDYVVIGCAISGADTTWINTVLSANSGEPYMDAISIHFYDYTSEGGFPEVQFKNKLTALKTLLDSYDLDIPIWITEAGFSTYTEASVGDFVPACTEDVQLDSVVMLHSFNKAYGLCDKIIHYNFYSKGQGDTIDLNWGVLRYNTYAAKPAYLGIAAMNYFIGGNADFVSKTVDETNREYTFEFYNNNLQKTVLLLINGGLSNSSVRSIDLDCQEVELYDKYGNFIEKKTSETGEFSIPTSTEPVYAVAASGEKIRVNTYIDYNTGIATVSGTTETPFDIVSLMLVTDGEPITAYDASRIEYLDQATADGNGDFSFELAPEDPSGDYQIYVNSKARRNKNIQDVVFTYSAAGIKLFKNDSEVTSVSQLSAGDAVNVEIGGVAVPNSDDPKILVAQYKNGEVIDVHVVSATGDASKVGNEITKHFTVLSGTDKIKVMYWKMDSMASIIESYEIN